MRPLPANARSVPARPPARAADARGRAGAPGACGQRPAHWWSWPRPLGRDLVLGGQTLELLEGQLDLVEQSHRPFRARAIDLPCQFLDLQALMGNHGLIVG